MQRYAVTCRNAIAIAAAHDCAGWPHKTLCCTCCCTHHQAAEFLLVSGIGKGCGIPAVAAIACISLQGNNRILEPFVSPQHIKLPQSLCVVHHVNKHANQTGLTFHQFGSLVCCTHTSTQQIRRCTTGLQHCSDLHEAFIMSTASITAFGFCEALHGGKGLQPCLRKCNIAISANKIMLVNTRMSGGQPVQDLLSMLCCPTACSSSAAEKGLCLWDALACASLYTCK